MGNGTMMQETAAGNVVTRSAWLALLYGELTEIVWETRWLMLAVLLCIAADLRYGWGECSKRYSQAKAQGDTMLMDKYKWRSSRAWRRSMNKTLDYFLWVVLGAFVGKAILESVGVDYIYGSIVMAGVAIVCEAASFFGHFFYLHGVAVEQRTVSGFIRAFMVSVIKAKNETVGEAVEAGLDAVDENRQKE